ncbi:hypothetical protein QO004_005804 [Rhizobium mesoamericanum]|uniref:hypothetical protein n=1 Tax=Rhizobium mesoamericanum TaxID=1079800 RepID=UPI002788E577|nr:hypothetical protein [Rhizobium mesoamericanum]MDQ0563987.1 hypothetical protein [Rhizobium mesoamericanum]
MQAIESGSIISIATTSPTVFNWGLILMVLAAAFAVGFGCHFALSRVFRRRPASHAPSQGISATERSFRNVYAIMTEDRRQGLIRFYQEKHECGREEAMAKAIDDRQREINRLR